MRKLRAIKRLLGLIWIVIAGCASSQAKPAMPAERVQVVKSGAECQILAIAIASTEPTCKEVKEGLASLLKSSPECAEIFTGNSAFVVHCPGDPS